MRKEAREVTHFFYSQAFADGFRATFAVVLPALTGWYFNQLELGLTLALGALCVSITDEPGPVIRKRKGMIFCILFIFFIAILTSLARFNGFLMGVTIAIVSFFFSMFTVYGHRAASVGTASILIMVLMMDEVIPPNKIIPNSLSIALGGIWYLLVSLFLFDLQPYRPAQRSLGKCIREIAHYLSLKADFYNRKTNLEEDYRKMVAQHIVVNEQLEEVRELLFKTRQIVKETTRPGKRLVLTFIETVDFFEDATASYYDYEHLRKRFGDTGILEHLSLVIKQIASELDNIGVAIVSKNQYNYNRNFDVILRELKDNIDATNQAGESNLILKKILVNLRNLTQRLKSINLYFVGEINLKDKVLDHSRFISPHELDPKILGNNLTMRSSAFRHAVRVSIACTFGFLLANMMTYGQYSYWILLTIIFIMKPAFSLTKQLNTQRILGTIAGGVIGVLILMIIPNKIILFTLLIIFLLSANSLARINYQVMVVCTTIYVLLFFSLLGIGFFNVVQERIIDTMIGGVIAFAVSYFLFPSWELYQLRTHIVNMLKANAQYLQNIIAALSGNNISMLDYKLARKEVYVSSANLSAAFQRMLSEPKAKQGNSKQLHQLVVLNHTLFSNIATIARTLLSEDKKAYSPELYHVAKKARHQLEESILKLDDTETMSFLKDAPVVITDSQAIADDPLLKEQLKFIDKICVDIDKRVEMFKTS